MNIIGNRLDKEDGLTSEVNTHDRRMTPKEAAEYIGCHHVWLAQLRMQKKGPPFLKFGKFVRYSKRDVDAWIQTHTVAA